MMNKKNSLIPIYRKAAWICPVLAVIIAIAYFCAMRYDYDFTLSYFSADSVFAAVVWVGICLAAALAIALALLMRKSEVSSGPDNSPLTLFGTVLGGLMALMLIAHGIRDIVNHSLTGKAEIAALILLPFIAASLFLMNSTKYRGSNAHKICASLAALSVNMSMFACYFDFDIALNSSVRNLTTVVQASVLMFLISEARLAFGVPNERLRSGFYIFTSAITSSAVLGFTLGAIAFKVINPNPADPNLPIFRLAMYLALACIAADRLMALPKMLKTEQNPASASDTAITE